MSGGGGTQQSNVTQTDIPEWLKPYTITNVESAQEAITKPYQDFGPDVAKFSFGQDQAQQDILQLDTPTGFGKAQNMLDSPMADYSAGTFDTATAQQFMDPYMQAVVNQQKAEIQKDYQKQSNVNAAQAVKAGAFGGGREGAQRAVAQDEMLDRMAQVQAEGQQKAYQTGMAQFNQEQQFQQQQAQIKQAQAASQAQLAQAQGEMDQAILKLQNAVGAEQQAQAQKELDSAKARFESARDYDRQNIMFMNAVLRGTPMGSTSSSSQFSATNPYAQAVGAGIAGLGAYQKFGG
jgi:hypothetical protein